MTLVFASVELTVHLDYDNIVRHSAGLNSDKHNFFFPFSLKICIVIVVIRPVDWFSGLLSVSIIMKPIIYKTIGYSKPMNLLRTAFFTFKMGLIHIFLSSLVFWACSCSRQNRDENRQLSEINTRILSPFSRTIGLYF